MFAVPMRRSERALRDGAVGRTGAGAGGRAGAGAPALEPAAAHRQTRARAASRGALSLRARLRTTLARIPRGHRLTRSTALRSSCATRD